MSEANALLVRGPEAFGLKLNNTNTPPSCGKSNSMFAPMQITNSSCCPTIALCDLYFKRDNYIFLQ